MDSNESSYSIVDEGPSDDADDQPEYPDDDSDTGIPGDSANNPLSLVNQFVNENINENYANKKEPPDPVVTQPAIKLEEEKVRDKEAESLDLQRSRTELKKNVVANGQQSPSSGSTNKPNYPPNDGHSNHNSNIQDKKNNNEDKKKPDRLPPQAGINPDANNNYNYLDYARNSELVGRSISGSKPSNQVNKTRKLSQHDNKVYLDIERTAPNYESESSAPIIDSNGGIHVADGRGGTYGIGGQIPGLINDPKDKDQRKHKSYNNGKFYTIPLIT